MKSQLAEGLSATTTLTVDRERTIGFLGEKGRVYATPMLVRDIEFACRELLSRQLAPGQDSVATRVEFDHLAACLLGMRAELTVTLASVRGRYVTFDVSARDDADLIGRGRVTRFIVDVATTEKRLAAKAQSVGIPW